MPAVGFLIAKPRQGRVGVGWRTLRGGMGDPAGAAALTVLDVDAALERLAGASGSGSAAERASVLADLGSRATAREQDFVSRVILGELRTGALEGVLTDAIARAAERPGDLVRRAAMLSGDLGETARIALTGAPGELDAVGLRVGRPVQPMLAGTAPSAAAALEQVGEASVEFKLDGARIQAHRSGDEVRVFTRNLADVTHRVPEVVDVVRSLPADALILDGETLALDEGGAPRPFQETMSRFGAETGREMLLHPWFFDVLHVDGRDLIDEPLAVRLAELARVAGAHRIPGRVTDDPEVAERVSRDALAAGHEGVVVKGSVRPTRPAVAGRAGSRSSPSSPSTSWCSPRNGARVGAPGSCRTCTSAREIQRASSARPARSSWSARRSRGSPTSSCDSRPSGSPRSRRAAPSTPSSSSRSPWSRSRSTACSARVATPVASPCASPG
ncbi:hypothetical protein GCM10025870_10750 [Agromyces marinus]|uniref:ATP-dependent DNA ligase family profile domain-containing protein n=1 Tax=Agromyces marinus TaxID=1389020 RepID=A0ABN6YCY7_9MICO|nr:hypothetical protein GCM10025870_10750 [Agromyces marinus]